MENDTPVHVVLSSLVYQMLEAKPSFLRNQPRFEDLKRQFDDPTWRSSSPKAAFAVLDELLEPYKQVYILLDRIDRIKGQPDRLMDPLVNLVKTSKCRVKVFLTASSNNQDHPEGS